MLVGAFRCRTWGATLHDADPRPPRCTAITRLNRRHGRTARTVVGERLRSTWRAGAALVGEPVPVTWSDGAALVGRVPATGWLRDRTRRHSDLISHQCRIVRKWRGILASRRTFKSYVGRQAGRTGDLGSALRKRKTVFPHPSVCKRKIKRKKKEKITVLLRRSKSACLPLSLSSHDSLGKRNVLVAPWTRTNANRVTIKWHRPENHALRLFIRIPRASRKRIIYYASCALNNTCGKQASKKKSTHDSSLIKKEQEREKKNYLPAIKEENMYMYVRN